MVIAGARAYESPAFGQFCELFAIDVVAMVHFQAEESGVGQFLDSAQADGFPAP